MLDKMHLQSSGEFHTIAGSHKSTKYFITLLKKMSYFRYRYLTWVFIFQTTFDFDSLHADADIWTFFVAHLQTTQANHTDPTFKFNSLWITLVWCEIQLALDRNGR